MRKTVTELRNSELDIKFNIRGTIFVGIYISLQSSVQVTLKPLHYERN